MAFVAHWLVGCFGAVMKVRFGWVATAGVLLALGLGQAARAAGLADAFAADERGDYATELRLLKPLAAKDDADAQYGLGVMYVSGHGVPQDYATAASWFRKAADQGNAFGQNSLGAMYRDGRGVPKDDVEAYKWYNLAAAQGDKNAAEWRDELAARMTHSQIAEAQKLSLAWKHK